MFEDHQPTIKQLVLFTVVLSFIVSVIGTVLALGTLGPLFGVSEDGGGPILFNKPAIIEKITETITERETEERVIRQDELVVTVVDKASPAVVSVVASKDVPVVERFFTDPFADDPILREFFGDGGSEFQIPQFREKGTQRQEVSSGTGFIVSGDGLLVTNKHVVADTDADYTVLLNDGRKISAEVLARDPLQDLAVLKIEGSDFPWVSLGDSSGVKIGQTVIAIGNALGEFSNTVSVGVVSGLKRSVIASGSLTGPETLQELIQTDAAINPGNSGGPLLDIRGSVIGINTAIAQGAENIGFAIPANKASRALENVQEHGRIIYPFLGVRYVAITKDFAEKNELARDSGVLIVGDGGDSGVVPGSPAAEAGLEEGDIILEFNGELVNIDNTLASLIQKYKVGEEVSLKVFRAAEEGEGGEELEMKATLVERE